MPIDVLPPEVAALLAALPPDQELPLKVLAPFVLQRVPLANACLTAWSYMLNSDFLDDLYDRHRGRSYEDILTFPNFVELARDALVLYKGSGRASLERADEQEQLPTCHGAFYGKLARIPIGLSLGFMEECTERLRALRPTGVWAEPLPASLAGMTVTIVDGKQIKNVAKRLLPLRTKPGSIIGGKILGIYVPAEGLVVAMSADPDGEANDVRLMPEAIRRANARIKGVKLWVADRQFCDLNLPTVLTDQGDHFLFRRTMKMGFAADPSRPQKQAVDSQGRTVIEQWGWIGAEKEKRRRYVRQIHLVRPGQDDVYLITDLLDGKAYPADDLLLVYLKRWEIERVFQKITEVFSLQQLIGCSPEATIFQASFCMVLYNLLQLMCAFMAASQKDLVAEAVSIEKLFEDVQRQLTTLVVLFPSATIAGWYTAVWTPEEVSRRLQVLMGASWTPRYRKAVNKKPRPKVTKAKSSGAHTSVHKVLHAERKTQQPARGDPKAKS
ncbi:MAG TPA: transposase [Isosphaeraceae bacterium]|nr:transposase [Isosphaeraceae bacterium]